MADVNETQLPGVGVRHDFTTEAGDRVAVLARRGGRRELMLYDRGDPDRCSTLVRLAPDDARTLAEVLGGSQVSEAVEAATQRIEGLGIDWLRIPDTSPFVGASIGDGAFRTRTGASIVAVIRGETTVAAPAADFTFAVGDVAVAVGTVEGLDQLRELLQT